MQEFVAKNSTLITDTNNAYFGLSSDYNHITVKHRSADGNYKTDSHFHTNNIENFWSTFKRGIIGIYHYVSPKHLHRYTTEFGYRYNNRQETPNIKFEDAINGTNKKTLTYKKLIYVAPLQQKEEIEIKPELTNEEKFHNFLDNIDPDTAPLAE